MAIQYLFIVFLWNLIAIEKEHVINIGEFKAVADIFIEKDNTLMVLINKFNDIRMN